MIEGGAVVVASNVEFIVLGRDRHPDGFRGDGVLVRSKNSTVDLIGFARAAFSEGFDPANRRRSAFPFPVDSGRDAFQSVESQQIEPPSGKRDRRRSVYALAWKGRVLRNDADKISDAFQNNLPDILNAYEIGDSVAVEWSISEVAYILTSAQQARMAQHRRTIAVLKLYLLMLPIASIAAIAILWPR